VSAAITQAVVEVGCGRGGLTLLLAHRFPDAHITAIDDDLAMIVRARILLEEARPRWAENVRVSRIRLQRGDATNLSFADRSFDATFGCLVLHHIPDWGKAV
jgi:ubiquinone/menaquinone biosynthesis C-methylase UbiE